MKFPKNRWLMALAAVGIQLSIGSIYAYSAWKMPLENTFGWSATKTSMAFSIAICTLGLAAAFLGKLVEKKGPRFGSLLATFFFSSGLLGSALACHLEKLWLFYLFFGVVSGVGLGLGYISPVSTLVRWFPKQRGLATGLAIMGFGFGGMVCTQIIDIISPATDEVVICETMSGYEYQLMTEVERAEVAMALVKESEADVGKSKTVLLYSKSNIVKAFAGLGVIYFCIMLPSAFYICPPTKSDLAAQLENDSSGVADREEATPVDGVQEIKDVAASEAIKMPVFYGLWFMLFLNATCGIALISTAKKMGYEMVHLSAPMASAMVMGISLFNGLGRIFWSSLSDWMGRGNVFVTFFILQIVAFPLLAHVSSIPWLFMAITFVILSCYGGGFATTPAYITDLFGMKEMPVILGWILTAWSTAGIVGPMLNAFVYEQTQSYTQSLYVFGAALVVALGISLWMKRRVAAKTLS